MNWYTIPHIPFDVYVSLLKDLYHAKDSESDISDPFADAIIEDAAAMTQFQKVKAVKMKMGDFHQKLLGSFPGWKDLGRGHETGLDVAKEDGTVFMEVKNATNTMNSGSAKTVNDKLVNRGSLGAKVVLVQINTGSNGKVNRSGMNPMIHVMDGKEAYAYVSGVPDCYARVLDTFKETFARFKTWREICEFRDQSPRQA